MSGLSVAVYETINGIVPEEDILLNEPMNKHTTFRIGGEALCFIQISDAKQLALLISYFNKIEQQYFILGNGSNLLVSDKGYEGMILHLGEGMGTLVKDGNKIRAGAGALLSQAARFAAENSLTGLEFASGIPGSVGGGIVMNAGAYGGEMKQVVESVTVLNEQGEIMELDNETMEFGYRTSIIKNRPFVVLEAVFSLTEGVKEDITAKINELAIERREKQPLEYASAGSTFKRPEGYYAGKLIMDAGLRGYSIGGAQVSEKHCGFVVNTGSASSYDVAEVIQEVKDRVKDKLGVSMEAEVIYLGEF